MCCGAAPHGLVVGRHEVGVRHNDGANVAFVDGHAKCEAANWFKVRANWTKALD